MFDPMNMIPGSGIWFRDPGSGSGIRDPGSGSGITSIMTVDTLTAPSSFLSVWHVNR